MEPLILLIEPELDERAATATMSRAQKVYEEGARDISRVMRQQITDGTVAAGQGFEDLETKARRAYLGMQDAGEKVAAAERRYEAARERGAANAEALGRRVERARLDEIQAIQRATTAYREMEEAAQDAGQAGERAGTGILSGLRGAVSGAGDAGGGMADSFMGGFAGSTALMRLGAAGGPIALGLAGVAALGVTAGKVLADNIASGLQSLSMKNLFQARLGVDDATMAQYGSAAGKAYADMWGDSVADNLRAIQFGVQGGVISPGASDTEIQTMIAHMQTLASVMEVDVQEAARAAGQLIRGGFAADGEQAADIIATGFQNGIDISGDWLDTITEYSTQFRKLGLDGGDAIGLISQGLEGGARDADKVADSLKEFSIRAVDGSKATAEGFAAIGLNADDMARRILAGGDTARTAFGVTLEAIQSISDPIQQALTWQALFGTQWEDMGDAINSLDLTKAREEFGSTEGAIQGMTDKLGEHSDGWVGLGREIDTTFGRLKEWLADSDIGRFLSQGLPDFLGNTVFGDAPKPGEDGYPSFYPALDPPTVGPRLPSPVPGGGPITQDMLAGARADLESRGVALPALLGDPSAPPPPPGKSAAETYKEWYQSGPPAGGADAPLPGAVTPILTETQQAAKDEAEKAAGGTGLPGAPSLPLQYTSTAGLPTGIANATTRLDEARHAVAEKEARVNQLMQSNNADADDIQKARNDLAKAQQSQMQAEQSLTDARINSTEKATKQLTSLSNDLSEMGNQLDADFGLSKGLGGFIENVVKAFGNALTAPLLAALGMVEKANPNEGSGLIGIGAANGLFGSQYTPAAIAATQMSNTQAVPQGYGGQAAIPGMLSGVPKSSFSDAGLQPNAARLNDIIAANFPDITDIGGYRANDPYPDHPSGRALDIMIPNYDTPEGKGYGDQINQFLHANAGALGLDSTIWQQQYQPAGGDPSMMGSRGSDTQNHMDHIHALTSAGAAAPSPSYPGVSPGLPTSAPGGGMYPGVGMPQSPMFGGGMPGIGSGIGQAGAAGIPQPAAGASIGAGQGGTAFPSAGGNSGNVIGGIPLDAAMAATAALDTMAPGSSAAAKIGIQLANRTVGFGAQVGGIAGSGVLETLSLGDNPKGNLGASWLGRGIGGLAGAAPALPNIAGGEPPGPMTEQGGGQGGESGTTINQNDQSIHVKNEKATEDQTGKIIAEHQAATWAPAGKQP